MFGMDVDARDILEGLKGRDTEGGCEGWSYQKQKDSLEAFNMDILICDNVVCDPDRSMSILMTKFLHA